MAVEPKKKNIQDPDLEKKKEKSPFQFPYLFYFILFVILLGSNFFFNSNSSLKEITWQEFNDDLLQNHDVEKIEVLNNEIVDVYIKKESFSKERFKDLPKRKIGDATNAFPIYYFRIGSVDSFEKNLEQAQANFQNNQKIPVRYIKKENWLLNNLGWLFPILIVVLFWWMFYRRIGMDEKGLGFSMFNFGKARTSSIKRDGKSVITFKDVAGYEEAKTEVMEVVEFLKNPESFTSLGAKIPKGVLLIGPPGTGKTLIAKAVAGEADVPFFSLSGSEFIEMFVGVGASRVRDLFEKAKEKTPSIIFIDEIDTIGRMRGKALSIQVNDERESTLNQLLAEMDGFEPNTGIIVLAATNRADILDPALIRPGRFDRHIYLELPNKSERIAVFKVHMAPIKSDTSVDPEFLASQTPGFSCADIANVCNEAALIAARQKKKTIELKDFTEAIDKIVAGTEKKSTVITPAEKKIIAYHEAGHAVVSWMLKNVDPLVKVSVIPRGKSLGSSWYLPEERKIITKAQFVDRICASLGGRAAEEVQFNEISSGAIDDLEKVTKQAYSMITFLGLNEKIGNISFYDSTGLRDQTFQKPYSEDTAKTIDSEVHILVESAYKRTKEVLQTNKDKLDKLAEKLLEKEVVYKADIETLLGARPM